MKKTEKANNPYSRNIILNNIYKIDGIDDVQQNANDIKKKKFRSRQKLEKLLTRFRENGLIYDYIFHKKLKGKTTIIHCVEILLKS